MAKAAAYYHDIGKIKKPTYFVENQLGGENKHEKLAPSMSSLVIQAHVKDGVELARQNKVSQKIMDIIRQHHGTSFMAYFYNKAKQQARNAIVSTARVPATRDRAPKPRKPAWCSLADRWKPPPKPCLIPRRPASLGTGAKKLLIIFLRMVNWMNVS